MPIDDNRLEQFVRTKLVYDSFPETKEFVMPTRTYKTCRAFMKKHKLLKDVRLIPYEIETGFNPTKALNLAVRESNYDHLVVTGPEVKPTTQILEQFSKNINKNIICQVFDQDENGNLTSLVNEHYRNTSPQPYFLALFQKSNIEQINGWDENFMGGYAYEDNDFGDRWIRAGIPFEIREYIQATHLYHPRLETVPGGLGVNQALYNKNQSEGVVKCKNGLYPFE